MSLYPEIKNRLWFMVVVFGGTLAGTLILGKLLHPWAAILSVMAITVLVTVTLIVIAALPVAKYSTRAQSAQAAEYLNNQISPREELSGAQVDFQPGESIPDRLSALIRDYQVTASQVLSAVEQINLAKAKALEAVSAFHHLHRASEIISHLGQELTQQALENKRAVQKCEEALQQTLLSIDRICHDSVSVSEEMGEFREAVSQVDHIIASIGQISQRTRLLSLNAAIEAARAGEHGRGFAVVAGEVKQLSDRTQQAVEQTGAILNSIREKMEQVEGSIYQEQEATNLGVKAVEQIQENLLYLGQEVDGMSRKVHEAHKEIQEYFQQLKTAVETLDGSFASIQKVGEMLKEVAQVVEKNAHIYQSSQPAAQEVPKDETEETRLQQILEDLRSLSLRPEIQVLEPQVHGPLLLDWLARRPDVEAVYSNRADGTFIFSQPPAALANAKIRLWWQKAIAGEEYISPVYVSAITRLPCRTIALPIRDNKGQIVGVLAADTSLS
ncbi:MAG: methyl-accepting chemotaxis protein [Moorellaceae bacterium]